ncbi:MAG TPA: porin family protein [Caulobacteraceae bacterium]|nr:porin family protein [Caulobacteraceae bacterium]
MKTLLLAAAAAIAAAGAAAPAAAQTISGYGTLGAEDINSNDANVGAVTGRLGARFGQYLGVEGELSGGFNSDRVNLGGTRADVRVNDQYAAYAVGFLPVMPNADLFARIGYGATDLHIKVPPGSPHFDAHVTSWNAGAGGQYFFDGNDGVRAEYTRETADRADLDANVFSLAYVRKF